MRPNADPASTNTVAPGLHAFGASHSVVWWDPRNLELNAEPPLGIRRSELIVKDVAARTVEAGLADYTAWRTRTDAAVADGGHRSITAQTVTQWSKTSEHDASLKPPPVQIIEVPRDIDRPSGIRFGALVHAVLGTVPLDANAGVIQRVTELHARTLGSTDEEVEFAAKVVQTVLALPVLERAREAAKAHRCRREAPIAWRNGRALIEGTIDLAFQEGDRWTLVDFKTDEDFRSAANYQRQVGLYALAVEKALSTPVSPFLVRI